MQTFLPYKNFQSTARVLDRQRLGKQRVETLQIMGSLMNGSGWANHPATVMWRTHAYALLSYQTAICNEWMARGYKDTCLEKTEVIFGQLTRQERLPTVPPWLGLKKFHSVHRGNLLRKDPEYYGQFGWKELPMEGYWWPNIPGHQSIRIIREVSV